MSRRRPSSPFSALAAVLVLSAAAAAQAPSKITNTAAEAVLKGQYNPADYRAAVVMDDIAAIAPDMAARVSPDSLKGYLTRLVAFGNRNTGSDTVSAVRGIGATRRWIHGKFQEFSVRSGGRLIPSYFQFGQDICGMGAHRNVMAVLPGRDAANHGVLIVEGHMDSRCEDGCDLQCAAPGADDNGSGTVLVLEAARLLSKYTFDRTLVFMAVTGEEQGTYGAAAFAEYCKANAIPVTAVLNNDIVGGITCGIRSAPPSCSPTGSQDSLRLRIFSTAVNFSLNKALARFVKGQYDQWIQPSHRLPMEIAILDPTDRTGSGGDHQPFSERGFPAIRFTVSHENGDGTPAGGRQHTVNDILGEDLDKDGTLDRYFVNFDYLARNTLINAIGLVGGASGPRPPDFTLAETQGAKQIRAAITSPSSPVGFYKVAVRASGNNDFALVHTLKDSLSLILPGTRAGVTYYVAVAAVDAQGAQSLYTQEKAITATVDGPVPAFRGGPSSRPGSLAAPRLSADRITFEVHGVPFRRGQAMELELAIRDMRGRLIRKLALENQGDDPLEVAMNRRSLPPGSYRIDLRMGAAVLDSRALVIPAR